MKKNRSEIYCFWRLCYSGLMTGIMLISGGFPCQKALYGQSGNLIRNPSFESGNKTAAKDIDGLDGVTHWKQFVDNTIHYTCDWFILSDSKYLWGAEHCGQLSEALWEDPPPGSVVEAKDGDAYVGTVRWKALYPHGEGFENHLNSKMNQGYHNLSFWYYPPCDTYSYRVEVFLDNKQSTSYPPEHYVGTYDLESGPVGDWKQFNTGFFCPVDNRYQWLIIIFQGLPVETGSLDGAYMYYDNFSLIESPCVDCIPHGPIAWNQRIPHDIYPNFVGTRDYDSDWFCVKNINNATHGLLEIRDAWGHNVSKDEFWFPSGSVNAELCWDGTDGGVPVTASSYFAYVQLDNCDATNNFLVSPVDLHPNPSGSAIPPYPIAPNYIPPAFGEPAPPFEPRDLHLYGGPYTGGYIWRACHDIYLGDPGNEITPYWIAGPGSLIHIEAGNAIYFMPGHQALTGANVSYAIDPSIQCCPLLRLSDSVPGIEETLPMALSVDTIETETASVDTRPDETSVRIFPNPFSDNLTVNLPGSDFLQYPVQFKLVDPFGRIVYETEFRNAGEFSLSLPVLTAGVYCWRMHDSNGGLSGGSLLKTN